MTPRGIIFFADRIPPLVGGMEMHARYFIEHFTNHQKFPLLKIITKNAAGENCLVSENDMLPITIDGLAKSLSPSFIFFNSGRWIEELEQIRKTFPKAFFLYRTGGNEILKAPLVRNQILSHSLRQAYWSQNINNFIDILITNSAYTELRLCEVGVTCPFIRCVGGVNVAALKSMLPPKSKVPTIFCAARFVPYKNHKLLLSVAHELALRGNNFKLRLAGDGPLFSQLQDQVINSNLTSIVKFLGVLDNEKTCQEIANADIYMQLSTDQITNVPGGTYIHSEGMGRSILEALTAGTFVIAGRSGALPEIVTENRGVLLDLNNFKQLIDKTEQILRHPPTKLPTMDTFSWQKIFSRYENLLENTH